MRPFNTSSHLPLSHAQASAHDASRHTNQISAAFESSAVRIASQALDLFNEFEATRRGRAPAGAQGTQAFQSAAAQGGESLFNSTNNSPLLDVGFAVHGQNELKGVDWREGALELSNLNSIPDISGGAVHVGASWPKGGAKELPALNGGNPFVRAYDQSSLLYDDTVTPDLEIPDDFFNDRHMLMPEIIGESISARLKVADARQTDVFDKIAKDVSAEFGVLVTEEDVVTQFNQDSAEVQAISILYGDNTLSRAPNFERAWDGAQGSADVSLPAYANTYNVNFGNEAVFKSEDFD